MTAKLEHAIRTCLVPCLREDGFAGSGRTFRRVLNGFIEVVNVQGSRYGGEFAINLGLQPGAIPDVRGNAPDAKKIIEPLCEFRRRLSESGADQWWKHDATAAGMERAVAAAADVYARRGRPILDRMAAADSPLNTVTAEEFEQGRFDFCGFGWTHVSMALALARLRQVQGRRAEAAAFARSGLAHLGGAVMLRSELEQLAK